MQEKVPRACSTCYFIGQDWFWQSDYSWYSPNDVLHNYGDGSAERKMPDGSFEYSRVDKLISLYVCNRSNKRIINDCPCQYWTKKI